MLTLAMDYWCNGENYAAYAQKNANIEARDLYAKAIAADQTFARPWADLAYAYLQAYIYHWWDGDPADVLNAMNTNIQGAVARGATDQYVLWVQADCYLYLKDYANAIAAYKNLGAPSVPSDLLPYEWSFRVDYADMLLLTGDAKQAISIVNDVLQNCPMPERWFYWIQAWAYYVDGQYQASLDALSHYRNPRNAIRKNVIASLAALGQIGEAQIQAATFLVEEKAQGVTYASPGQPVLAGLMAIEDRLPLQSTSKLQQWKNDLGKAFGGLIQP